MRIQKNSNGLYIFDVEVRGDKKSKTLQGLIDTGSTDCAATYKVITTLYATPIDFAKVGTIDQTGTPRKFVYSLLIGFGNHFERTPVIRVQEIVGDVDFVLGMSFLSHCTISIDGDVLEIQWKK